MHKTDVIIIGAGAAGLLCAIEAGKRGRKVIILEKANKPGKKILMSGGGRCNFTNLNIHPDNYISHNKHFCKSALSRYSAQDFIALVKQYNIAYHEKKLGQLFCDHKSQDILNMLLSLCEKYHVKIYLNTEITSLHKSDTEGFNIKTTEAQFHSKSLVIATGGLSIPTMGASPFGYKIAEQFGLKVWPTRAGLVPLTLHIEDKEKFSVLSGVGTECIVSNAKTKTNFRENILFTHRGLSGPAILQISSYWNFGEEILINLLPDIDLTELFKSPSLQNIRKQFTEILTEHLPKRLIEIFLDKLILSQLSDTELKKIAFNFQHWRILPNGTEGYRTAEVTLGGVDCNAISSKTMEALNIPGLYFIGEVLDVSGWLGGYNFQWAWASGHAAGQVI
jgi:predicted Rossmann fold flavoprotein